MLEREFADEKLCALLVLPNFSESDGRKQWGFLTPPVARVDFRAALVTSCFRGPRCWWTCERFA
ncbi:hypothetical protein RJ641_036636 [Dillenia turbinata]|uniref:Uncharacterized protein n=1 Tax=Dillenia turbinata TaxID=194707 RepID=A0AAN8VQB4_9MAGN